MRSTAGTCTSCGRQNCNLTIIDDVVSVCDECLDSEYTQCDDCGEFFIGTGYEPNVLSDLLSDEEQIICKDCAVEQHALSIALGQELDSFKRELFQ